MNTEQYMHMMAWLQALTGLIEQMQVRPADPLRFTSALSAPVASLQEEFVSDVALLTRQLVQAETAIRGLPSETAVFLP